MSRVKILSLLLVVMLGSSHATTDCTGLTGEHLANCTLHPENYIVVLTKSGPIGGSSSFSVPAGREFWSFKGIPYAQPPVGKLRMRNPVKVKPWTIIRWSLDHGNICIQNEKPPKYQGSEDCLFLNIFLPKNVCTYTNRCPVIFLVHPSNFYTGSGNSDLYGAERFMAEPVIQVTMNYRLGAMGYSNSGDQNIQGNAALMDLVMALLWVKDNIRYFGGEPALVNLAGDGASLCYLCTAEYTKGLFNSIMLPSATCLSGWTYQPEPQKRVEELAAGMNLTYTGMPDLAEKLRNAPVQDILTVAAYMRIQSQGPISQSTFFPFSPAADKFMPHLVPKNPRDFMNLLLDSDDQKICHGAQIISGSTILDGGVGKVDILQTPTLLQDIQNDHELLVPPVCVNAPKGSNESVIIGNKLFDYYFKDGVTDLKYYLYKTMLATLNGNIAFAAYNIKNGIFPYFYIFCLCSETNYMRRTLLPEYSCPGQVGPIASDGGSILYYQTALTPFQKAYAPNVTIIYHNDRTDEDRLLTSQQVRFLVNFARTGNPNGCGPLDPLFKSTEWKPTTDINNIQAMYLNSTLKMDAHAHQQAINFWATLCTT